MKWRSRLTLLGVALLLVGSGGYAYLAWPAWDGARLAREDLLLGRARFLYCGELIPYEDEVVTRFMQRFKLAPYRWASDVIDSRGHERASAYNAVVFRAFNLSPDAFEDIITQVMREHQR
jgi:hypothetical protein